MAPVFNANQKPEGFIMTQSITRKVAKKLVSKVKVKREPSARGFILYRGPSMLDGANIVVIATMKTANPKTGDMVQTFILVDNMSPLEASKQGKDTANCGNCRLRWNLDGPCYVNLGQAPNSIYKALERGIYPVYDAELHSRFFVGRDLRMGAYGDPAAVPVEVWEHRPHWIYPPDYAQRIQHKVYRHMSDQC